MKGIRKLFPTLICALFVLTLSPASATAIFSVAQQSESRTCHLVPGDIKCVRSSHVMYPDDQREQNRVQLITLDAVEEINSPASQQLQGEHVLVSIDERDATGIATLASADRASVTTSYEHLSRVLKRVVVPVHEPTTFSLFMAISLFLVIRRMNK